MMHLRSPGGAGNENIDFIHLKTTHFSGLPNITFEDSSGHQSKIAYDFLGGKEGHGMSYISGVQILH